MHRILVFVFLLWSISVLDAQEQDYSLPYLIEACQNGQIEEVKRFIKEGTDINAKDRLGNTPLIAACSYEQTEIAKLLIEKGADVNVKNYSHNTPLILACSKGLTEIAKLLIEKGADINAKANNGYIPLMYACTAGDIEIVKLLIEKDDTINAKNRLDTLLNCACSNGQNKIAKFLIEKGADFNAKNIYGKTLLMGACSEGQMEIAKLFIEKGADINAKDNDGKTSLIWACEKRQTEIVSLLVEKGADFNAKDNYKNTPLIVACSESHTKIAKLLIKEGADVNVKDANGYTPLIFACLNGDIEVVKLLIKKGAEIPVKVQILIFIVLLFLLYLGARQIQKIIVFFKTASKYIISFFISDWNLDNYPLRFRKQSNDAVGCEKVKVKKWLVQIINWGVMSGLGETKEKAYKALQERFNEFKYKNKLPRPGSVAPLSFAPSEQINEDKELLNDFLVNIIGFGDPCNVWVSDSSSLGDFCLVISSEEAVLKIKKRYGVDVSGIEDGNLAQILNRIKNHPLADLFAWKIADRIVVCCRFSGKILGIEKELIKCYDALLQLPMNVYIHSLQKVEVWTELEPGLTINLFKRLEETQTVRCLLCEVHKKYVALLEMLGLVDDVGGLFKIFPTIHEAINFAIPEANLKDMSDLEKYVIFQKSPFKLQDLENLKNKVRQSCNIL